MRRKEEVRRERSAHELGAGRTGRGARQRGSQCTQLQGPWHSLITISTSQQLQRTGTSFKEFGACRCGDGACRSPAAGSGLLLSSPRGGGTGWLASFPDFLLQPAFRCTVLSSTYYFYMKMY